MPLGSVLAFWGVAALLIAVPGADWAFTISAGLRRHVLPAAGGIVLGYLAMTMVVAAGLGVVIASTPAALLSITVAGGIYLVRLGFKTVRDPAEPSGAPADIGSRCGTLLAGMAVSGLNPKGLLIFVAMLPQFTDPGARWPVPVQMGVLGLTFVGTCAVVYPCVGAGAQALLRARPAVTRTVSRISGVSMILVGTVLVAERLVA